jgi:ABC-type multidrug transport system fused ATPase/permease subunit
MAKRGREKADNQDLPKAKLSLSNFKKSLRLFEYLGKNRWKFIFGMFFLIGTAVVGLIFPLISGKMLSYFGETGKSIDQMRDELFEIGKWMLLVLVLQGFFSFGRVFMFAQVTENILKGLRDSAFNRLVQMPMSFFSQNQVGELSSRIATDVNVISEAFTVNIAEVIRQSIIGIGGLILILNYTSWEVAKWFLMIIPPVIIIAIMFGKRIRKFSKAFQDKIAESNVVVVEALTGISSVKTFTNESYEIKKYESITEGIRQFGMRYGIFRGVFFAFIVTFIFGAVFFILWKMLLLKSEQAMTAEVFGKFLMLAIFVAGSLSGLPEQLASIQRALGATDRLFEMIDNPIEDTNISTDRIKDKKILGHIQFKNIHFSYPTRAEFKVLKNLSFEAKAGETIAIVGKSGSGKSTLAALVLRFYDADSGQYLIDGKNALDYELSELRDHIAIVPQDVLLFSGSIRDNIAYGKLNASEEEINTAAKQANAYDFIMSFPDQFNTLVGERGVQLSGGQRQRVAIARALLNDPAILILDEATSSLDSESEKLVQQALETLMKGRTSLVIAHRLSTIKNADKIIVLDNGSIKEEGTHEMLMGKQESMYKHLTEMQSLH